MNPIVRLSQVKEQYEQERLEKTELDAEVERLQRQLRAASSKREQLRNKIANDAFGIRKLEREAELYKREKEISDRIAGIQGRIDEILASAPWMNRTDGKHAEEFQIEGATKLAVAERGILADKRGLGKSLSSLVWRRFIGSKRTLVLAPKRLAHTYIKQLLKWEPGVPFLPLYGRDAATRMHHLSFLQNLEEFVVISNYESWRKSPETLLQLKAMGFDALVADEAHHLMTPTSNAAKGVKELALNANIPYFLAMTGTPILNKPQELWIQLHMVDPIAFPSVKDFLRDYAYQVAPNRWRFNAGSVDKLMERLSRFFVSRKKSDVGIQVPDPEIIDYELDFSDHPEQEKAYRTLTERAVAELESGKTLSMPNILSIISYQRQMTSYPAGIKFKEYVTDELNRPIFDEKGKKILKAEYQFDVEESVKIDWAMELTKDLVEEGERVIILSNFVPIVYELEERLHEAGINRIATLTGKTAKGLAERIEDDFNPDEAYPKYNILIATYDTVGEGMNLHAAGHMLLIDRRWSQGREDQGIGRIDRMDSTEQATVHVARIKGTIDEWIDSIIDEKSEMLGGFESNLDMQKSLTEALRSSL